MYTGREPFAVFLPNAALTGFTHFDGNPVKNSVFSKKTTPSRSKDGDGKRFLPLTMIMCIFYSTVQYRSTVYGIVVSQYYACIAHAEQK